MKNLLLATIFVLTSIFAFTQVANYVYTATTSTWAANATPTVITGLQSTSSVDVNDVLSSAINIGFTFNYGFTNYTQFKASENGFITFNTSNTSSQPTNNLNTSTERTIVAVLWDDNNLTYNSSPYSNVNYKLTGTSPSRVLTIEWSRLTWIKTNNTSGTINCQIKLYETTNVIEFIYDRSTTGYSLTNNPTTSIGLGGPTSGDFLSLSDLKASTYPTSSNVTETSTIGTTPMGLISGSLNNSTNNNFSSAQLTTRIGNGTKYRFTPPLVNDNSGGAITVTTNSTGTCTTTTTSTTLGATQTLAAQSGYGTADDDVWFKFVSTAPSMNMTVSLGTIGDLVIEAYTSSIVSIVVVDASYTTESVNFTGLTVGSTYYFRVYSFSSSSSYQGTFTICVTTPPTISTSGTLTSFSSCSGTVSSEKSFSITGYGLLANITITAPAGFELSTTSGGTFTSPITLTQSGGGVSATTIYVRMKSTTTGSPSGNITCASTSATTQNVAVSGVVSPVSVGGVVDSNQSVLSGGNAATVNLSGHTGSVTKWQRSTISDFSTSTDVANTTTSVSGASMGAITESIYYRAVVQSGTCATANSAYVKITMVAALPIELLFFKGKPGERENHLEWSSASEMNNDYYTIYYMNDDDLVWKEVAKVDGVGNSSFTTKYSKNISYDFKVINYYMLEQTDYDGKRKTYNDRIISIDNRDNTTKLISRITNILGQDIDDSYRGMIFIIFSDGSTIIQYRE